MEILPRYLGQDIFCNWIEVPSLVLFSLAMSNQTRRWFLNVVRHCSVNNVDASDAGKISIDVLQRWAQNHLLKLSRLEIILSKYDLLLKLDKYLQISGNMWNICSPKRLELQLLADVELPLTLVENLDQVTELIVSDRFGANAFAFWNQINCLWKSLISFQLDNVCSMDAAHVNIVRDLLTTHPNLMSIKISGWLEWNAAGANKAYLKLHQLTYKITVLLLAILPRPIQQIDIMCHAEMEQVRNVLDYMCEANFAHDLTSFTIETDSRKFDIPVTSVLALLNTCTVLQEVTIISYRITASNWKLLLQYVSQQQTVKRNYNFKLVPNHAVFMVNHTTKELACSANVDCAMQLLLSGDEVFESFAYDCSYSPYNHLQITLPKHVQRVYLRTLSMVYGFIIDNTHIMHLTIASSVELDEFLYVLEHYKHLKYLCCSIACEDQALLAAIQTLHDDSGRVACRALIALHCTNFGELLNDADVSFSAELLCLLRVTFSTLTVIRYRLPCATYYPNLTWPSRQQHSDEYQVCWGKFELRVSLRSKSVITRLEEAMEWEMKLLQEYPFHTMTTLVLHGVHVLMVTCSALWSATLDGCNEWTFATVLCSVPEE